MKLAWLIYDREYNTTEIVFEDPRGACSGFVTPIVYTEIKEQSDEE